MPPNWLPLPGSACGMAVNLWLGPWGGGLPVKWASLSSLPHLLWLPWSAGASNLLIQGRKIVLSEDQPQHSPPSSRLLGLRVKLILLFWPLSVSLALLPVPLPLAWHALSVLASNQALCTSGPLHQLLSRRLCPHGQLCLFT